MSFLPLSDHPVTLLVTAGFVLLFLVISPRGHCAILHDVPVLGQLAAVPRTFYLYIIAQIVLMFKEASHSSQKSLH